MYNTKEKAPTAAATAERASGVIGPEAVISQKHYTLASQPLQEGKPEKKASQAQRVICYLDRRGSITQLEALHELGVMRLSARISELKKEGYPIIGETEQVKNRFGEPCRIMRYRLSGGANG